MPTLYFTIGLPAAGKSTWAREQLEKDTNLVRVNKDDLRAMLHGGKWAKTNERQIIRIRDAIILDSLRAGRNIVVDDTNLHPKHEIRMREIVKELAAEDIKVKFDKRDFTDVPVEVCIERDAAREHPVGEDVIRRMYRDFLVEEVPLIDPIDRTVWFTSDLHFGHQAILKYAERPWDNVLEMNEGIVARWNSIVKPEDEVWVLGDVAMGKLDESLPYVTRLHGHKHLVAGNHDRCWSGSKHKGAHLWTQVYHDAGFESIVETAEVLIGDERCWVSHFPYKGGGDHTSEERYSDHRLKDDGRWLLQGHVHSGWLQKGRMINVGIDAWDGFPVPIDALAALILAGPKDLPVPVWNLH